MSFSFNIFPAHKISAFNDLLSFHLFFLIKDYKRDVAPFDFDVLITIFFLFFSINSLRI